MSRAARRPGCGADSSLARANPSLLGVPEMHSQVRPPVRPHHSHPDSQRADPLRASCPWISGCVGLHNERYFLLFLVYFSVACGTVAVQGWKPLKQSFAFGTLVRVAPRCDRAGAHRPRTPTVAILLASSICLAPLGPHSRDVLCGGNHGDIPGGSQCPRVTCEKLTSTRRSGSSRSARLQSSPTTTTGTERRRRREGRRIEIHTTLGGARTSPSSSMSGPADSAPYFPAPMGG